MDTIMIKVWFAFSTLSILSGVTIAFAMTTSSIRIPWDIIHDISAIHVILNVCRTQCLMGYQKCLHLACILVNLNCCHLRPSANTSHMYTSTYSSIWAQDFSHDYLMAHPLLAQRHTVGHQSELASFF